jgi:hypothetical protein
VPLPDSPEELARERLGFVANDWERLDVVPPSSERSRPAVSRFPTATASDPFGRDDPPDGEAAATARASLTRKSACAVAAEVWVSSFAASGPPMRPAQAAEATDVSTDKKEIRL